jgi:hypothetical protein
VVRISGGANDGRDNDDVAVIGLHTVFEHHAAMTPVSLEASIHEYRLTMPIGVDQAGDGTPIPLTMQRYGMRGTPTTIIIDRAGRIRHHGFGQDDDLTLGLRLGALLAEPRMKENIASGDGCADGVCIISDAAT